MADSTGVNVAFKKELIPVLEKYGVTCIIAVMIQTVDCRPVVRGKKELSRIRSFFLNKISVNLDSGDLQKRWVEDFVTWIRKNNIGEEMPNVESN